ncbi:putative selenium-dependent hydroxylase accessory protein YqeC [Alkalibaculum sp. M08DMB]|uniref:Putative selenium-dependent hydroxylase accessory protein YqeC n=1 Tax=Alkalibaculum sporogenes TaxID=2655001 RepID=A0A6A7KAM7_9FIRM|nr:selenium cofactor biosynthesis protein YqeC [Alkalibaculum sporogenes]MPW26093.1 putative selenium-dependent hydroxylase accessory protein YqeC [Alkalibaculum sporogenes]
MKLSCCIDLNEKDIISIVGAGGKTSLMFELAQEIKKQKSKILTTTTTKIYVPTKEKYDYIFLNDKLIFKSLISDKKGIYVYGKTINTEGKIIGLSEDQLNSVLGYFDYMLIEADGANEKSLKGWNSTEPVIYSATTKTIGLLDIQSLGMTICENSIHRFEEFCKITTSNKGEKITLDHLLKLIIHPQGLFKNSKGEKILFINKADNLHHLNMAMQLINSKIISCANIVDKIIVGSIKNKNYTNIGLNKGVDTVL